MLLEQAQAASFEVHTDGGRLVIRGPQSMEVLARQILAHQGDRVRLLPAPPADVIGGESCGMCGSRERWQWLDGRLICRPCLLVGNDLACMAMKVWSNTLNEAVWVVADDLPKAEWPTDAPVYTHTGITILQNVGLDTRAWVRATEQRFGADVVASGRRSTRGVSSEKANEGSSDG
jgi:hypothetical protein